MTSTSTATATEASPFVFPDAIAWPDMDIACEWGESMTSFNRVAVPGCDRPAEWIMWRGCCADKSKYRLYCTGHKNEILADDGTLICWYCDEAYSPARQMFRLIEPLK